MAIIIQKSKINGAPVIFGAPVDTDTAKGVEVKFGYGTLENVLAKVGAADDGVIYFGYDDVKSTGAIVSRGKLVSSKILDITTTAVVTVSFKDSLNSIHKENFELSIKKNGDTWFVKTLNHGVSQDYFKEEKEK